MALSKIGGCMGTEARFAEDEFDWARNVMVELRLTPSVKTFDDAIAPMRQEWPEEFDMPRSNAYMEMFELELGDKFEKLAIKHNEPAFRNYPRKFAKALYGYSLEKNQHGVSLYKISSTALFEKATRSTKSAKVKAVLVFYKFLIGACNALPDCLRCYTRCHRGVKWVFPSPDDHNPESYFHEGRELLWFEFKSSTRAFSLMGKPDFCGHEGPRTVFSVKTNGSCWDISDFSAFGTREQETLFLPLTAFRVAYAQKKCLPQRDDEAWFGFPDEVVLEQYTHDVLCLDEVAKQKAKEEKAAKTVAAPQVQAQVKELQDAMKQLEEVHLVEKQQMQDT